jgi:hypothetical protein
MTPARSMSSVALSAALDFFPECTVPVLQWLTSGPLERQEEYIRACAAYAGNRYADFGLRTQPHVAYDVSNDAHYFIFKQDDNGTCIIAGEHLPKFSERDLL